MAPREEVVPFRCGLPFERVHCTLASRDWSPLALVSWKYVTNTGGTTISVEKGLLWAVRVGVFLVLLMPMVVTQSTLFPYIVGKAIYARSLIEITFAFWIVLAVRAPAYRPPRSWLLWLFAMFLFVSFMAAVVGVSFQRSFWGDFRRMGGVFDLAHWFAYAVVLVSVLRASREWRWLLNANLSISLLIALLGLSQHFDVRVFDTIFWYLQPTGRLDITFGNSTYVGAYMLVNLFVALAFLASSYQQQPQLEPVRRLTRRERRQRRAQEVRLQPSLLPWRAFWAITLVMDLWVLTLSGTRGAVAGLIAGLLIAGVGYMVWGDRRRLKALVGALMAAFLLLALVVPLARDTAPFRSLADSNVTVERFRRLVTSGAEDLSIRSRLRTVGAGLEAFAHAPVLGWGPENFAVAFDRYVDPQDFLPGTSLADQAHNKPVEELTTKGILGFASYSLLIGWMVRVLVNTVRREPYERWFALFLGAGMVAYVVQNLFLFDSPAPFLQFVLLLGWVGGVEGRRSVEPSILDGRGIVAATGSSSSPRNPGSGGAKQRSVSGTVFPPWAEIAATIVAPLLVVALLYSFNYRLYRAAQDFPLEASSMEDFFSEAQDSFEAFPPLATLGRQILLDTFSENWNRLTSAEGSLLLTGLQTEAEAAFKSEPQNARLLLGLARVYQRAGASDAAYLPIARSYVEASQMLAPGLLETIQAAIRQEMAEERYAEAMTMAYEYVGSDSVRGRILMDVLNEAQRGLIAQIGMDEYLCRWAGKGDLTLEERAQVQCEEQPTS